MHSPIYSGMCSLPPSESQVVATLPWLLLLGVLGFHHFTFAVVGSFFGLLSLLVLFILSDGEGGVKETMFFRFVVFVSSFLFT